MAAPSNDPLEWITLNLATTVTAIVAYFDGHAWMEVLAGMSILALMFFNFWRGMNQWEDWKKKVRDAGKKEK